MSYQLDALTCGYASGCPVVVMVQPTHHRKSDHLVACILNGRTRAVLFRDLLSNTLMWSCPVEVPHIRIQNALELRLLQDQQMVETFLPYAPQEPFTDGIRSWGMNRRFEQLDAAGFRHPNKAGPKFAIVISNQILGRLLIGGGFSQLLCHPRIGRRSCHTDMDHLARFQFDNKESEERSKEQVSHLQEVACPDLSGVGAQKGRPLLASWLVCVNRPHVLLDGALAHPNAQFQQFSANALSTPESIRHLPDQGDGFGGYFRLVGRGL